MADILIKGLHLQENWEMESINIDRDGKVTRPLDLKCEQIAEAVIVPSADVEPVVRCKDCHFFKTDYLEMVNGVPLIVAHNICTRWGKGCQTAADGFCFMAIRQVARVDGEQNEN